MNVKSKGKGIHKNNNKEINSMKIAFINNSFNPSGGVGRVMFLIATELVKRKYDVSIISLDGKKDENHYNAEGIKLIVEKSIWHKCYLRRLLHKVNQKTRLFSNLNNNKVYDWIYLPKKLKKQFISIIQRGKYDVVIGVQGNISLIVGSISSNIKSKTIGWQHSSYDAYFKTPGLYMWHQDNLIERYYPQLNYYVVLNEYDQMCLEKRGLTNIITIHNPRSFVSINKTDCCTKRFISVGHLIPTKGFDLLIKAFAEFAKTESEWVLNIYGDGPDKKSLQKEIDNLKIHDRVILNGFSKEIQKEMLSSSVYLLSSRWEGMPMVVLEALEIGLPIIAFNITAMLPLVVNGKEGILVPKYNTDLFAQAMKTLSDDYKLRENMSRQCIRKAEEFTIDKIADKWMEIL